MSPNEGPLAAKLDSSPRFPDFTTEVGRPLSGHNLASPSRGTCPSPVEGRGTHGQGRAHRQMDHIEAKSDVTQRCRPCPRSRVSPGQAQTQGCGWRGLRANSAPSVVPATHDHRRPSPDIPAPRRGQRAQKVVACDGFRRPALHASNARLDSQGSWSPGGAEAIALPHSGQFRGGDRHVIPKPIRS